MDNILQVLMSWQFIIFSLGIVAITSVLRTVVEYILTNVKVMAKESKLWNDLILPIMPVVLGSVSTVFIKGYPYPEGISATGGRFVFGLVAGLLSTLLYRIVKALFNQKLVASLPPGTIPVEDPTADALIKRVGESINKE
jgi:uncharacterized membrane protein YedE/YeeE